MGTLFKQSERRYRDITEENCREYCDNVGINFGNITETADVIALLKVMEYSRRTDVMVDNGDRWDEQIAGIGEILKDIATSLEKHHTKPKRG
jgi:hypothetical protein